MNIFGKERDALDLLLALAGLGFAIIGFIVPYDARWPSLIALGILFLAFAIMWLIRWTRKVRYIPEVEPVMKQIEKMAKNCKKVWTVRSHIGQAESENKYFETLASRVISKEIKDFRRIIRISNAKGPKEHLKWLIDTLGTFEAVKVRFIKEKSALFDFSIFDGVRGGFGFPDSGAEGFYGAIFLEEQRAVLGLAMAFDNLWDNSIHLFSGRSTMTEDEKTQLKKRIDDLFN